MTSYANVNEPSSSATATTTTNSTTTTATAAATRHGSQIGDANSAANEDAVAVAKQNSAAFSQQRQRQQQLSHYQQQQMQEQQQFARRQQREEDLSDYEEREEKADTTPENIKKIDDIIELELERERERERAKQQQNLLLQQQQQNDDAATAMAATPTTPTTRLHSNSEALALGLAVAIDESNAKFCFVRKPPTPTPPSPTTPTTATATTTPTSLCIEKAEDSSCYKTVELIPTTPSSTSSSTAASPSKLLQSPEIANYSIFDDSSTASNLTSAATTTTTATTAQESDNNSAAAAGGGDSGKQRACAFTLSFDNEDSNAAAATAARYKSVMERFQSRHRRGASMSKLDNGEASGEAGSNQMTTSLTGDGLSLSSSASASPLTLRAAKADEAQATTTAAAQPKVKLRPRDRSTSRVRDAAKRHSWSPRSTSNELSVAPPLPQPAKAEVATRPPISTARRSTSNAVKTKPPPPPPLVLPKGSAQLGANRSQQFTPRSTAMQLALQKIDLQLPQAPLGDFERGTANGDDDEDDVSEAGTYTLDGDNYTEEQKDLMNIDKSLRRKQHKHDRRLQHSLKERVPLSPRSPPSPLKPDLGGVNGSTKIPIRTSNVLEVNYFHTEDEGEPPRDDFYGGGARGLKVASGKSAAADLILGNSQHGGAYLGNIRSRVLRNLFSGGAAGSGSPQSASQQSTAVAVHQHQHQKHKQDADVGCFTSVTTSGVLAKQSTLDPRPKLNRKNSLTTSQIDSSEYISNEAKLKHAPAANIVGGYTDHQKAEYRLNLFTNQKDLQKYAATRNLIETPPETPSATTDKLPSDTAALTMAQNKNDWIQQWARNARARSEAACVGKQQQQQLKNNVMTRSYNCGSTAAGGDGSLTDDSLYSQLNHYHQQHFRDNEFDYSSDPTLMCSSNAAVKPPKSPSKIPSPLHSIGRARSASRTRGSLQGLLAAQEDELGEDIYLQKTAAAINNLQQSISRKNSIKSPTGSMSSPRRRIPADNSAEDSPLHSIESDGYRHPPHSRHRRNLSNEGYAAVAAAQAAQAQLMTSSFNEQQLQLLTSGEYLMKQMRMRKNSFDGSICSPRRRVERAPEQQQQATISPLHRAGSFSMKGSAAGAGSQHQHPHQHQRAARPQYQHIYTPPAARQGYVPLSVAQQHGAAQAAIKKSASSNNFGHAYDDDYDENLSYYINDADDDELCDDELEDGDVDEMYADYADEYVGGSGSVSDEYGPRTITLRRANMPDDAQAAPLTSTRYNKALLMRIERSKQRAAATGNKPTSAPLASKGAALNNTVAGLVACPNTPELPRRNVKSAPRAGGAARQSVPREASLSRLASQVPNSLASAKRQLLQTAAAGVPAATARSVSSGQRVQPKYLDISKYKPAQGNAFLRKNESKSTLKTPTLSDGGSGIKRSPSSSGLSRADPTRASNRSIRSVMTTSCTGAIGGGSSMTGGNLSRASSAVRRDDSVSKQKEIEMAMWKRRSTYDPLKAAAEDRRRKEEAKRLAMAKNAGDMLCESAISEPQL